MCNTGRLHLLQTQEFKINIFLFCKNVVTPLKLESYQITVICDDMNFVAHCHDFPCLNLH